MEENIILLHIAYEENLSLESFLRLMEIVNESFDSALTIASIEHPESLEGSGDHKFYIKRVKEGSFIFEIIVPILVGVCTNVISELIITSLKNKLSDVKAKNAIDISGDDSEVSVHISKNAKIHKRTRWTAEEDDILARKAADVYVNRELNADVDVFMRDRDFINVISAHGVPSVYQKIRNIRHILDVEKPNGHTLNISPLSNCSEQSIKAVKRYLR